MVINKLATAAMIEIQMPNTTELANVLPLPTARQDMHEQWRRQLLKNPLIESLAVLELFARVELGTALCKWQAIILSMGPEELGTRLAVLMLAVRVGDRSLSLAWQVAITYQALPTLL